MIGKQMVVNVRPYNLANNMKPLLDSHRECINGDADINCVGVYIQILL
jgi:hypothetical protein